MSSLSATRDHTSEPLDALTPELQRELTQILEDYLADLERGQGIDPEQLIAAHPTLSQALRFYLEGLDFLRKATADIGLPESQTRDLPYRELGDFCIVREIGRGGMGIVYEAEQKSIGRRVALKVLPFAAVLDQKQILRFRNEAQAAGQLNHPHIVPVYSVGCERGVHYYSMQLIEGQPLDRAIQDLRTWAGQEPAHESTFKSSNLGSTENGPWETKAEGRASAAQPTDESFSTIRSFRTRAHIRSVAILGCQAARGLHHAHELGIVHRDVKPSNLLLDRQSKLWITDFGLARCQAGTQVTMTGDMLGTARYMSPEQAAGQAHLVDHRTDIYSLGVTLYELLTLRPAIEGTERQELMRKIEQEDPVRPRRMNASIPQDLETIILKSISKSVADRYPSAQTMAEDLERFLAGKPTLARRPTIVDLATKWALRHRKVVALVFGILCVGLFGSTVAAVLIAKAQQRTAAALVKAETNFRQTREVVGQFGTLLSEQLATVPGTEGVRHSVLRMTLHYYEQFVQQSREEEGLQFDLAFSYSKIAELRGQLGELKAALTAYEEATYLYEELARAQPGAERYRYDLASCLNNMGRLREQQGATDAARSQFAHALEILETLMASSPDEPNYRSTAAVTLTNLGSLQRKVGSLHGARDSFREAIRILEELLDVSPEERDFQAQLASAYNEMSFLNGSNLAVAMRYNTLSMEILQQLTEADPDDWKRRAQLAAGYNNQGSLYRNAGRFDDARQALEHGIAIQRNLVRNAPDRLQFQNELAVSYNNLGQLLAEGSTDAAAEYFRRASELFQTLIHDAGESPKYRASLGGVFNNLGLVLERAGRGEEAAQAYESAIAHQRAALEAAPQVLEFRNFLSTTYVNYGRVSRSLRDPRLAAEVAIQRRALWEDDPQRLYKVSEELAASRAMIAADAGQFDAEQLDLLTNETLATLLSAVEAGFGDHRALATNVAFANLHSEPRFEAILSRLARTRSLGTHGSTVP